jgi:hypothetical protein
MSPDALERILDPEYLSDLESRPLDEVRSMRTDCQDVETGLSYLRRLAQGRLDIIEGELRRRTEGGDPGDLSELIGRLPEILSDRVRAPGLGRLPQQMAPAEDEAELVHDLDAIIDADRLTTLPEMSEDEVRTLQDELRGFETEVSAKRRELHQRIDALQAEITRRYRTGEASVETLLR